MERLRIGIRRLSDWSELQDPTATFDAKALKLPDFISPKKTLISGMQDLDPLEFYADQNRRDSLNRPRPTNLTLNCAIHGVYPELLTNPPASTK